jgi:mandelate racemase
MTYPLGTSVATVRAAPLLLIDLETEEGVTGRSYLFCYTPAALPGVARLIEEVLRLTKGERIDPSGLWGKLAKRFTLIGVEGIVRMAMSGFDIACWDALAVAANRPLSSFLGGQSKRIMAYNSSGLGLMGPQAVADEAEKLLVGGFQGVKLRLGYATVEEDVAAVRAVRRRLPDKVAVMVDYNQALSVTEALHRCSALESEGIYWIEEPIRHDDYAGYAQLSRAIQVPLQIGENFSQTHSMAASLTAGASTYVMPDVERIGGVTGWRRASALAASKAVKMSSHLSPELSVHLLAATTTCHWLEYVDWADAILEQPLLIDDGFAMVPDRPGFGLVWREDVVRRLRVL